MVESGHSQELSIVTLEGLLTENVLDKREEVVGYGEEVCGIYAPTKLCRSLSIKLVGE